MSNHQFRLPSAVLWLALVPALALTVAATSACAQDVKSPPVASVNGSPSAGAKADGVTTEEYEAQSRRYVQCLADNGYSQPDDVSGGGEPLIGNPSSQALPPGGPAGKSEKQIQAEQKCASLKPQELTRFSAADLEKQRKLVSCLRANGLADFPDAVEDIEASNEAIRRWNGQYDSRLSQTEAGRKATASCQSLSVDTGS